jgi:hypothetical protein
MANRPDAATISFTVNLPPEVIQTYFEGLAKVEKAKRSFPTFELSVLAPLLPMVVELVSPYMSKVCSSEEAGGKVSTGECTGKEPCHSSERSAKCEVPISKPDNEEPEEEPVPSPESSPAPVDTPTHRPAYDEDSEVPLNQGGQAVPAAPMGQMPDMANIMESMGPVMQQFASAFGMSGAAQPPKAHKHVPTKKTSKKSVSVKPTSKPKPRVKVSDVPTESPAPTSPAVDALNARLEALVASESLDSP